MFDDAASDKKDDVTGKSARFAQIVRRHDDLDAGGGDARDDVLDEFRLRGVEAGGRLVEEQHFGVAGQRAGERQALLFATR